MIWAPGIHSRASSLSRGKHKRERSTSACSYFIGRGVSKIAGKNGTRVRSGATVRSGARKSYSTAYPSHPKSGNKAGPKILLEGL